MDDLIAFVTARLDEDEAAAQAATPGPWRAVTSAELEEMRQRDDDAPEDARPWTRPVMSEDESRSDGDRIHIARHDPARVLREVAAKRRRLERYLAQDGFDLPEGVEDGRDPDERERDEAVKLALEDEVREDAAVCGDHPDYRQEWAPVTS